MPKWALKHGRTLWKPQTPQLRRVPKKDNRVKVLKGGNDWSQQGNKEKESVEGAVNKKGRWSGPQWCKVNWIWDIREQFEERKIGGR